MHQYLCSSTQDSRSQTALAELELAKVEVAGSKPISRSTFVLRVQFELAWDRKWRARVKMSLSASRAEGPQSGQKLQIKCSCWVPTLYFNIVVRPRLDTACKIPDDERIASSTASRGRWRPCHC